MAVVKDQILALTYYPLRYGWVCCPLEAANQLNTQCAASNTVCQASAAMARWTQIVEPNVKSRQGQR